jgi:predicted Fe-Mo cluster-binding NifX family protein
MKLAVTYDNGEVFQHFGHTEYFKIYTIEDGAIVSEEVLSTNGQGHGALAGFLQEHQVNALICGGIGGGARTALAEANVELYPGASGNADAQVTAFLSGQLQYNPDTQCADHEHHHHGEGCHHGDCGSHC